MEHTSANRHVLTHVHHLLAGPLFASQGGPLTAALEEGDADSKVLLIVGDNASGKSFMVQLLAGRLNQEKVEPIQVSMKYRTKAGMHQSFMYGPLGDAQDSTGNISINVLGSAFNTAENRETPCWLMLDEPDMGLADSYCAALGTYVANFGNRFAGTRCEGLVVVTHSRKLVNSLLFSLEKKPHVLCLSSYEGPDQLQAWLEDERERTLEELTQIGTKSLALFRSITVIKDTLAAQTRR